MRLTGATTVHHPDTDERTTFLPSDDVPDWAKALITNPSAWEDGDPAELRGPGGGGLDTSGEDLLGSFSEASKASLFRAATKLGILDLDKASDKDDIISAIVQVLLSPDPLPVVAALEVTEPPDAGGGQPPPPPAP